ncbi:hypothetical protein P255_02700 [Acinetobacter brisouii CIP 110357]|uniref:Uncharacterized protein n=1 Tax=Acinetobacter brisouii CIP 110357 TaxID=1341683 RepID=V2UKG0_9GAMM|nr:hypothetical protein F954_00019 [Acinetobacter brisouii ANC 4119]ESK49125.1 hypothetical protein P255_02700 [Acinetobacter brisouii CIP 110357]
MQRISKLLYIEHLRIAFSDEAKTIRMDEIKYGSSQ